MSVFNNENEVNHAIKSIFDQDYHDFEFLIIDDASTDNTFNILMDLEDEYKNLKIFKNSKNLGLTKSLNKLIDVSSGDLIARQDADDFSLPHRFSKQLDFLKNTSFSGCTTRTIIKGSSKIKPKLSMYPPKKLVLKFKNPFIHGSLMIKKDALLKVEKYDERFIYAQDYKLFRELTNKDHKIGIIREPLYVLNTENNISTRFQKEQNFYADCVRKNNIPNKQNVKT